MPDLKAIRVAWLRYADIDAKRLELDWLRHGGSVQEIEGAVLTRRSEWLAARAALRQLLDRDFLPATAIKNPDFGFPELVDKNTAKPLPWYTSWTHSEGFCFVVLSEQAVGVDAEPQGRKVDSVLTRIASAEEIEKFKSPQTAEGGIVPGPLALWCAKEAIAKATGLGMRWGLKNFEIGGEVDGLWEVAIRRSGPRQLTAPAVKFLLEDSFVVAVCSERALLLQPFSRLLVR